MKLKWRCGISLYIISSLPLYKMQEEPLEDEMMEELEEAQQEQAEDSQEDNLELSRENQEAYGDFLSSPEAVQNQHTFIHKATFDSEDTVRTTFLSESELGRPLFSVRFLLDLHDISKFYLDPVIKELKLDPASANGIANYFWDKIQNITASGMSNKGFSMNLNVTRKMDTVRERIRESIDNLKQGKSERR